ncbi:hypothetical protein D9758_007876 [Tetrapyrgos nigripes]|uniref:Bromodomain associated domain-containing protein n=1 Tax=Tetrapyrgos nigripes TaxID=182062 RepID=A0A8H5D620_9AGAR|nr:hypothetical protein D9758_007876 [Tetrapyrgos nigripes]
MSESGAQKLLESAIHRTLHAHSFSRSSSQASLVLTDLLHTYLTLLSSTCAKYAQHAGRTRLNARDALSALEELGVTLDELHEYGSTEGMEFRRYAYHTQRRADDLKEFKAQLLDGTRADHDDAIPLTYAPVPDDLEEEEEEETGDEEEDEEEVQGLLEKEGADSEAMDIDALNFALQVLTSHKRDPPRPNTPPLPLSPVSIPSTPSKKRPRTLDWEPPGHIPDFLPPFPVVLEPSSPTSNSPRATPTEPPPIPVEAARVDKPPQSSILANESQTQTQTLASTSASASDYFAQVPYSQSSLSSVAEWHLPSRPSDLSSSSSRTPRWATPSTEESMITAYHHILTSKSQSNTNVGNPLRHKVAMALLGLTQSSSRWDVSDTLYSNISPNQPRVAPIGPTYPIQIGENPLLDAKKDKSKESKYPAPQPRSVATIERLSQVVNSQGSRIPDLARHVLHPATLSRTSRLSHPPVLYRDGKPLTYGNGVPAPWNTNVASSADAANPQGNGANKKDGQAQGQGQVNGVGVTPKESAALAVLPDARLYGTWDYESKDYRVPLANTVRGRAVRIGGAGMSKGTSGSGVGSSSGVSSAGTISLSVRGRSASRAGRS